MCACISANHWHFLQDSGTMPCLLNLKLWFTNIFLVRLMLSFKFSRLTWVLAESTQQLLKRNKLVSTKENSEVMLHWLVKNGWLVHTLPWILNLEICFVCSLTGIKCTVEFCHYYFISFFLQLSRKHSELITRWKRQYRNDSKKLYRLKERLRQPLWYPLM